MIEFCLNEKIIVTNTTFKHPKRHLYTWKAPADGHNNNIIINQIDYIIFRKGFRNAVICVKTYPEADISSDHNSITRAKIKFKNIKCKKYKYIFNLSKLKNNKVKQY